MRKEVHFLFELNNTLSFELLLKIILILKGGDLPEAVADGMNT